MGRTAQPLAYTEVACYLAERAAYKPAPALGCLQGVGAQNSELFFNAAPYLESMSDEDILWWHGSPLKEGDWLDQTLYEVETDEFVGVASDVLTRLGLIDSAAYYYRYMVLRSALATYIEEERVHLLPLPPPRPEVDPDDIPF